MEGENRQREGQQQEGAEFRPPPDQLQCPRCQSLDTKFCYFNNNKSDQPRYLCKTCKRHWTHGGKLRNIPPGGVKRARGSGGVLRVAVSSPPPSAGFGAGDVHNSHLPGGRFGLGPQRYTTPPQQPAPQINNLTSANHTYTSPPLQPAPQVINLTSANNLSLLRGPNNGFNPLIIKPFGQDQGQGQSQVQDRGQGQGQSQSQSQSQSRPVGQLNQAPDRVHGLAVHPNRATGLQAPPHLRTRTTPASATTTANYPPNDGDADIYWENNLSTFGGNSGGSSSMDWFSHFPDA